MSLRHKIPFRTGELPVDNLGLEIDSRRDPVARINFQTEIVNGDLSCAKRYSVAQWHPVLLVMCLQFALTTKAKQC